MTATATRRPNIYAGTCRSCGGSVAAQTGLLGPRVAGRWTVEHVACPATQSIPAVRPASGGKPRCAECQRNAGVVECRDSSGIVDLCCHRCAQMSVYERSFA